VVAIALSLVILGALLLVTWNAQRAVARLGDAAEFSVFLTDAATSEQRGAIEDALDRSGLASGREYVSKQQAAQRFRASHTDLAPLADSFDDEPFPASIEVRLQAGRGDETRITGLIRELATLPGVEDVRYDRDWLVRLDAGLRAAGAAAVALALVVAFAAAVTVAAVVRLGLESRRGEVEIMELVGAPMAFIRGPFVAEGLVQGGLGAVLALVVLWFGYMAARGWWGASLDTALNGAALEFLPMRMCAGLLVGGMAVGAAGGFAASRHAGFGNVAGS
jgi:cell division transport system permease protein